MKHPFYIIAHHINNISQIIPAINDGANAIECDIKHDGNQFIVCHGAPEICRNPDTLVAYLQSMDIAAGSDNRLALVIFDVKDTENSNLAIPLLQVIRQHLTAHIPDLKILISVASFDARHFLEPLGGQLTSNEALAIDEDNDPSRVSNFFQSFPFNRRVNYAFGNGITSLLPENPFATNIPNSIMEAVAEKALTSSGNGIKLVYVWTLDRKSSMRNYLRMGVDGIMTNDITDLSEVINEPEFFTKKRKATRNDNPFSSSTLPAYVLTCRTGTRNHAGTDANLRFELTGELGIVSTTINAEPPGLFEQGDENRITLFGEDVGALRKLMISRDTAGNAPGWFLWDVFIQPVSSTSSETSVVFDTWIQQDGSTRWMNLRKDDLIREFAVNHNFGITGPITNEEVKILAREWMPEIRFHENENFHCISFGELLSKHGVHRQRGRKDHLEAFLERPEWTNAFPPPIFFVSDNWKKKVDPDDLNITSKSYMSNLAELYFSDDDISSYNPYDRSPWGVAKRYFGSDSMENGIQLPGINPITAHAEFRDLRQTLFFRVMANLEAEAGNFPVDDEGELLDSIIGPPLYNIDIDDPQKLEHLQRILALLKVANSSKGTKINKEEERILQRLVDDDVLTRSNWEVIRNYVFLEYYLVYVYNDITKQNSDWLIFTGDHEGDVEGVGVVFHRADLMSINGKADRTDFLENDLKPHFLISSAHEPNQGLDQIKETKNINRNDILNEFKVWVMPGSHASFLVPGEYDNLEAYEDPISLGGAILAALNPINAVPIAILIFLLIHFILPDEETSDNGVHALPPIRPLQPGDPATRPHSRVLVTPLSQDRNLYQESWEFSQDPNEIDATLAERSFPGAWGFDGPRWINKTDRFIKKLAKDFFS